MSSQVPNPLLIQIAAHSSDLIGVFDLDYSVTSLNDAGRTLIHVDPEALHNLSLPDMFAPHFVADFHQIMVPTALSKGVWEGVTQFCKLGTNQVVDVHCSVFAVRDDEDALTGFAVVGHDISADIAKRARLVSNVETFNDMIKGNPFGVYVIDSDFNLSVHSLGARRVFENIDLNVTQNFADIIRLTWTEPFATDVIAIFRHTLATGESYASPSTIESRADIEAVEAYDWRIDRIEMPDGRYGVVCYFYDLSEREQWAGELMAARAREAAQAQELEVLYNEAPLGLAMIDRNRKFVRMNAAFAQINDLPEHETVKNIPWDSLPDARDQLERAVASVMATGQAIRNVTIVGSTSLKPTLMREWINHLYPVYGQEGDMTGVGLMVQDITQQRLNEEAIRSSERRLRLVLDQLFAFVGILSPDGYVTYTNKPPLQAAGLNLEDVEGRHFADAPWWNYDADVQDQIRHAIKAANKGKMVRYDVPVRLGADLVTIDFQLSSLRDDDGEVIGLIPSGVVVEDRVQAERALRSLTNQLEERVEQRTQELIIANAKLMAESEQREAAQAALLQSNKLEAIGRLVSGVAHDFNNILAAVLSGLSLVERRTPDPATRDIIRMSASAAQRGAGLIKQMLAFARKQPLTPTHTEIMDIFTELQPLIQLSLPPGVHLKIEPDDEAWPIIVDSGQLHSALLNLALNARDAMPDGGELTISCANCGPSADDRPSDLCLGDFLEQDFVAICIRDTGTGMSPDVLAKFAEPFFTTKGVGQGTGLGVAMVYGFVNQSGGTMLAQSTEGVGTSITLYLPRAAYKIIDRDIPRPNEVETYARRILVVDDDHDLRFITAATLMEFGFDVSTADNAQRALALLDNMKFDLVVTDIVMPDIDGLALAQTIRSTYSPVPILFMTGFANKLDMSNEIVVNKPFEANALLKCVQNMLMTTRA